MSIVGCFIASPEDPVLLVVAMVRLGQGPWAGSAFFFKPIDCPVPETVPSSLSPPSLRPPSPSLPTPFAVCATPLCSVQSFVLTAAHRLPFTRLAHHVS